MKLRNLPVLNTSLKDIKGEKWEDIPRLDGACQISNYGRVKVLRRWVETARGGFWLKEKILKIQVRQSLKKPLTVNVSFEKKKYGISIARYVYCLFVKKFDTENRKLVIDYKDGNPYNITLKNLVLSTASSRITKAYKNNRRPLDSFGNKALSITQYSGNGEIISEYASITAAAKKNGLNGSHIGNALNTESHLAHGFLWYYGSNKPAQVSIPGEARRKISKRQFLYTPISQYDEAGNKIAVYPSIPAAAKAKQIQLYKLQLAVTDHTIKCGGFFWRSGKGPKKIDLASVIEKRRKRRIKNLATPVTQYDLEGNRLAIFPSQTDAAKALKKTSAAIFSALNYNENGTAGGYIWRYGEGPVKIKVSARIKRKTELEIWYKKPVSKYDIKGRRVQSYSSVYKAAGVCKLTRALIVYSMMGSTNRYGGYYWREGTGKARINVNDRVMAGKSI
jgi:NUMOD4 motif/NUMOD1 domain